MDGQGLEGESLMALPQGQFAGFQPEGFWSSVLGIFLGGRAGSPLRAFQVGTVTFTSAAVGAISITEQAVSVAGLLSPNDLVLVSADGAPTANVGALGAARVSAAGVFQLRYVNPTAGALTPPAATVYRFVAFQVT
jgi:hypothetical protein